MISETHFVILGLSNTEKYLRVVDTITLISYQIMHF